MFRPRKNLRKRKRWNPSAAALAGALTLAFVLAAPPARAEMYAMRSPNRAGWFAMFPDPQHFDVHVLEPREMELSPYVYHSSHYVKDGGFGGTVFDQYGEIWSLYLNARMGLTRRLTLDAETNFHSTQHNSLREFIHRSQDTDHEWKFILNGSPVYSRRTGGVSRGDATLGLTWLAWEPAAGKRGPRLTLRGFAELPTGDEDEGFGSGGWDLGATLASTWELKNGGGARLALHLVQPGDYDPAPGLDFRVYGGLSGGVETPFPAKWSKGGWRWLTHFRVAAHAWWSQSPLNGSTGIAALDKNAMGWLLGFVWTPKTKTRIEGHFMEDTGSASPAQTQDYGAGLGFRRRFNSPN